MLNGAIRECGIGVDDLAQAPGIRWCRRGKVKIIAIDVASPGLVCFPLQQLVLRLVATPPHDATGGREPRAWAQFTTEKQSAHSGIGAGLVEYEKLLAAVRSNDRGAVSLRVV